MRPFLSRTHPRVGLLGNPSDGYGGRVLGFTFASFSASVLCRPDERIRIGGTTAPRWRALVDEVDPVGMDGLEALLVAAIRRLDRELDVPADTTFSLEAATDIPRQVGLSGSSALVVAALEAVAGSLGHALEPALVADMALRAETEELGIVAGPQDRVVQSWGGFLDMRFDEACDPVRLDCDVLPPMLVAWQTEPGACSGASHADVRERWLAGDDATRDAMTGFARLAAAGVEALAAGDPARLCDLVDENFDRRVALFGLGPDERAIVEVGRAAGAAAKFCGSGGAALALARDANELDVIEAAYRDAGYATTLPIVTGRIRESVA